MRIAVPREIEVTDSTELEIPKVINVKHNEKISTQSNSLKDFYQVIQSNYLIVLFVIIFVFLLLLFLKRSKNKYNYISPPQMIHIAKGSYTMGSDSGEDNEKPPHNVTIDYDFEIGKYEVTIGEYKKCVADGGCKEPEREDYYKKMCLEDNCPAIGVDWNGAKSYTKWLSQKTGQNYRLPTEAEWEYVARAGTQTKWSFGDKESQLKNYAWYDANSDSKTHPKGTKKPNPWGVYDIHGNVWEWCEDWYVDNYKNTPKNGSANAKGDKKYRVLRGGSWSNSAIDTRSAYRGRSNPTISFNDVGFRLQRTLP